MTLGDMEFALIASHLDVPSSESVDEGLGIHVATLVMAALLVLTPALALVLWRRRAARRRQPVEASTTTFVAAVRSIWRSWDLADLGDFDATPDSSPSDPWSPRAERRTALRHDGARPSAQAARPESELYVAAARPVSRDRPVG